MISFFANNLATILISAVLAVLMVLAIAYVVRQHKKGTCVGCGEKGCASCGGCSGACSTECPRGERDARHTSQ